MMKQITVSQPGQLHASRSVISHVSLWQDLASHNRMPYDLRQQPWPASSHQHTAVCCCTSQVSAGLDQLLKLCLNLPGVSCSLSSPAAMSLPALQGAADVMPAAAEPENIMLSEQPSAEELRADEQYLAGAIAEWLDDEWTPLSVHRELGAAAGQVCRLACVDQALYILWQEMWWQATSGAAACEDKRNVCYGPGQAR